MNDDERPDAPETRPSKPAEDNKGTLERIGSDDLLPPASSRKPRSRKDELPLDDGLPGILDPEAEPLAESEERAPASRKVASQRGSNVGVDDLTAWEIDGLSGEAPPTRKALSSSSAPQPQAHPLTMMSCCWPPRAVSSAPRHSASCSMTRYR
jgi:hypothetical protein